MKTPENLNVADRADFQQCEAEYRDIGDQMAYREAAFERGEITEAEYRNWVYDFGDLG